MSMDSFESSADEARARAGSPLSDEEWEALRGRLKAAILRACPHWLMEQVEDIVQAALVQLLGFVKKSEGKKEFSSIYLAKVAHGATVDEIRRRSRRRETSESEEEMMKTGQETRNTPNPERESAMNELGLGVRECLARMVRPRMLAVILHLHGCTVPETARRYHWTAKKAENLVYRGLKDLRRCLASKGFTP